MLLLFVDYLSSLPSLYSVLLLYFGLDYLPLADHFLATVFLLLLNWILTTNCLLYPLPGSQSNILCLMLNLLLLSFQARLQVSALYYYLSLSPAPSCYRLFLRCFSLFHTLLQSRLSRRHLPLSNLMLHLHLLHCLLLDYLFLPAVSYHPAVVLTVMLLLLNY